MDVEAVKVRRNCGMDYVIDSDITVNVVYSGVRLSTTESGRLDWTALNYTREE